MFAVRAAGTAAVVAVVAAAAVLVPSAAWAAGTSVICRAPRSVPCTTERGGGYGIHMPGGPLRITVDLRDAPGHTMGAAVVRNGDLTKCRINGIPEHEGWRTFTCLLEPGFFFVEADADTGGENPLVGTAEIRVSW